MLDLDQIQISNRISGLEPNEVVQIIALNKTGSDSVLVTYRRPNNLLGERMLYKHDEAQLNLIDETVSWDFSGDPDAFKLAVEAYRVNVAYLFDPMMAVHTSNVEPLPHQITAVYGAMLPRQPLRFVLADDPGAGKTIMAGLLIKELILRGDADRVLIVAPGSLVSQWQEELLEKFDLDFGILSKEEQESPRNPFERQKRVICRLDQLSRNEELSAKAADIHWDLIIFDEAHKLGAHFFGNELKKTKRFNLGELLGATTQHFLLMTATPHNGKEEDFQAFLSLLDSDRFYGKQRDGAQKVNIKDLMRRMVKEDLRRFNGTKLFPERKAITVTYELSDDERELYDAVTRYVREEMNRAEQLAGEKKNQIGFALASLQRRLASSPAAIHKSLENRIRRLEGKLEELRTGKSSEVVDQNDFEDPDDLEDELPDNEYEELETKLVSTVTAAETEHELKAEIETVKVLCKQALELRNSGLDRKWERLSALIQETPEVLDKDGRIRKLIIFTEYRDTLEYLKERIQGLLGRPSAVVDIHGGTGRDQRKAIQEDFCNVNDVQILVATDAASEGVNLQRATNLMINYDLPWNPNRLEQRFGRIHRIGQKQVCWLWNMVSSMTREGDVYRKLLEKIEAERQALGGRVFDILGELFEEKPLRELLLEAIRYGEDPARLRDIDSIIDKTLSHESIQEAIRLKKEILAEEALSTEDIYRVKEEMDRAEAQKLQPYFIRSFFLRAAQSVGIEFRERGNNLYEISHVPQRILQRDRLISGRDVRYSFPISRRYDRIAFEREQLQVEGNRPAPALMHPGHPLMQAMTDLVLEDSRTILDHGSVLIDPNDSDQTPKLLVLMEHSVREGSSDSAPVLSKKMQFVAVPLGSGPISAGSAPHLDLEPASNDLRKKVLTQVDLNWLKQTLTETAPKYAADILAREHFESVRNRRERWINATLQAVHDRLTSEIRFQQDRLFKLQEDIEAGNQPRVQASNTRERIDELVNRLENRKQELERQRHITSSIPRVISCALVVPAGFLQEGTADFSAPDPIARARIEQLAMKKVLEAERARGNTPSDVSASNYGWDITSRPPMSGDQLADDIHIEVKGRQLGQSTVTVSRNEVISGLNQGDQYILAVALIADDEVKDLYYIKAPFSKEPDWAETSKNLELSTLLNQAERIVV